MLVTNMFGHNIKPIVMAWYQSNITSTNHATFLYVATLDNTLHMANSLIGK